jgi:diacylglycerol kinase (ATP)
MKYIFLNPHSCSGLALKKWEKVKIAMPELKNYIIVDDFYKVNWSDFKIEDGDIFISAGGDGTLHSMVNALIKNKGLESLNQISVGHIGLGSNNSYLRPYNECTVIHGIPLKISEGFIEQDLIEIQIKGKEKTQTIYCVANSSLGFLSTANILFNSDPAIAVLKKMNSDAADVFTFFKALGSWKSHKIEYNLNGETRESYITNMHFMKRPYYAADLGFPESISPKTGSFRFNILMERSRPVILKKFLEMLLFKNFEEGRDTTADVKQMTLRSSRTIPIEADGEIYYGDEFNIKICSQGIKLCK